MIGKKSQSALLAKYYAQYKKKPRSKVFAPLAESFRRLGMLDDAYKILKEGIKFNPNYALGYVVLSHCYFDQEKFDLAYHTLRPLVSSHPDNISMQKIFAESCLKIGHNEEALETYKYLLFLNPRDKFFAEQVKKLEDDLLIGHKILSVDQLVKAPDIELVKRLESQEDDWVQVDFNEKLIPLQNQEKKVLEEPKEDNWVMRQPNKPILAELEKEIEKRDLEDDYFADEFESEFGSIEEQDLRANLEAPIISHTLIDLYCSQSYFTKAEELLEQIIALNPNDESSKEKLNQVKILKGLQQSSTKNDSEEDGHAELISIIEKEVKHRPIKKDLLEIKFQSFLNALKERAVQIR